MKVILHVERDILFKKLLKPSFIISVLFLMLIVALTMTFFVIPGRITVLTGEDYTLSIRIPLQAYCKSKILTVNSSQAKPINGLEKPYTIKATEEGEAELDLKIFGIIPFKTVQVRSIESQKVIASGAPIGIKLKTNGIIIINVSGVIMKDGTRVIPAETAGLITGDILKRAGGKDLNSISDLIDVINNSGGAPIEITYRRQNAEYKTAITPVKSEEDDEYRIGIWVRDSSAGIGTLTFIDPGNKIYGALGHGINDIDTGSLLQVGSGSLLESTIQGIKRGMKGSPGELEGDFLNNPRVVGDIKLNCDFGIFGKIDDKKLNKKWGRLLEIGPHSTVKIGKATILACINKNIVEEFDIEIQRIAKSDLSSTKNMVLRITDQKLLESTGGIVQGMSGSPIIQDGRIIGAVTHVFINDPMRGYGVFIESMLDKSNMLGRQK
ncbi:MAG: SpoIVB peptidase [Clostridiaceae bacterium]|mgnify:CR=1 FL=1|jgi:stage IV sporulation protein B|nr:SpoIVB peptidase [Clostridiaceae bacterium]